MRFILCGSSAILSALIVESRDHSIVALIVCCISSCNGRRHSVIIICCHVFSHGNKRSNCSIRSDCRSFRKRTGKFLIRDYQIFSVCVDAQLNPLCQEQNIHIIVFSGKFIVNSFDVLNYEFAIRSHRSVYFKTVKNRLSLEIVSIPYSIR